MSPDWPPGAESSASRPASLGTWAAQQPANFPDEILNPVEVSGEEAVPIIGRLPGARRMYVLPADRGEHHLVGSQVMTRIARPIETGNVHELVTFAGRSGATMPRHVHLSSHAALLVLSGEVELELNDQRWRMMRGDFANLPAGTPHGWTMRSDRAKIALFTMNDRVGAAFVGDGRSPRRRGRANGSRALAIPTGKLARPRSMETSSSRRMPRRSRSRQCVANLVLPLTPGPYVLADGGGERFGGNTFLARNANTTGQFLFLITEGGPGAASAHTFTRGISRISSRSMARRSAGRMAKPCRSRPATTSRRRRATCTASSSRRPTTGLPPSSRPESSRASSLVEGRAGGGGSARAGAGEPDAAAGGGNRGAERRGGGARGGFARGGPDMFRTLQMSGRGPDGYPLDVHPAKLPLPPQDPVWTEGEGRDEVVQRAAVLAHAQAICGVPVSREITPELRRALALKPNPDAFL